MRGFLLRLLVFAAPFVLLGLGFVALDPFKVVWPYESFVSHNPVSINEEFLATETYLRNRDTLEYRAFIFGSSRTLAFSTADWERHTQGARAFRFNASRESLFGVLGKIRLLEALGDRIDHALLLLERGLLEQVENSPGHLYIKHPRVSGEGWGEFYVSFFSAYLADFFFLKHLDYLAFGVPRPYMDGAINLNRSAIDPISNDLVLLDYEAELREDPEAFYAERERAFDLARRSTPAAGPVIGPAQEQMLREIRAIFSERGTAYELVISPNYDRSALAPEDLRWLESVFGASHVHDYAGENEITADRRNYYEPYHFRPKVGTRILDDIYGRQTSP